jgi:hypothetical protein
LGLPSMARPEPKACVAVPVGKLPVMPSPDVPVSPPLNPAPSCAPWLLLALEVPLVLGAASPPEEPAGVGKPLTPAGVPGDVSGAEGAGDSVALAVAGLPGRFGLPSTGRLQPTNASASNATSTRARPCMSAGRRGGGRRAGGAGHA